MPSARRVRRPASTSSPSETDLAITISAADANGASGTTSPSRTKPFAVKVFQGATQLLIIPATPSGGKWTAKWPQPLGAGSYTCEAGTASKQFTVAAPPPPPPPPTGRWYSDASPFNKQAARAATVRSNSGAILSRMLAQGQFTKEHWGEERTKADFSHPFYFATTSDPLLRLSPGYGNTWKNLDGDMIHVPLKARAAGGSDGSMTIVQPDGWEYNLWLAQIPNQPSGQMRCGFAKKVRHDGTGLEEANNIGGITAAGFANGLGVIRLAELKAGQIDHALFFAVNGWHGRCYPGQLGGQHSGEVADTNAPPMGCWFRLNMAASAIEALSIPPWHKAIVRAWAEYGGYVGDQSGSVIALQTESDVAAMALGQGTPGADWCRSVGLPSYQSLLYDVDKQANVTRTVYTMDWTKGIDWKNLQALNPPA